MAILAPFATNGIVIFKGEPQGIDLRMATRATFKLLMFENSFADRGSSSNVRLVNQDVGGWLNFFVIEIFPLKTTGSFFTSQTGNFLFIILAFVVGLMELNKSRSSYEKK